VANFQIDRSRELGERVAKKRKKGRKTSLAFYKSKKVVQNFAPFLKTFDFDREYLRNGSTYQKSEKLLKIYIHSHVG